MNHIELTMGELEDMAQRCEARAQDCRAMAVELRALVVNGEVSGEKGGESKNQEQGASGKGARSGSRGDRPSLKLGTTGIKVKAPAGTVKAPAGTLKGTLARAAEDFGGPFSAEELRLYAGGIFDLKQVADFCSNATRDGVLNRVGRGRFIVRPVASGAKPKGPARGQRNRGELLEALRPAVAGLKAPFGVNELMAVGGVERKKAQNWFTQAGLKGWVKRIAYGVYERSGKFPKGERGSGPSVERGAEGTGARSGSRGDARPPDIKVKAVVKVPEPSEKERAYQESRKPISVPRDPVTD